MKKYLVTAVLSALLLVVAAPAVQAEEPDFYPEYYPTTCLYERWYPGAENCGGEPWVISIQQECMTLSPWTRDPVCRPYWKKQIKQLSLLKKSKRVSLNKKMVFAR